MLTTNVASLVCKTANENARGSDQDRPLRRQAIKTTAAGWGVVEWNSTCLTCRSRWSALRKPDTRQQQQGGKTNKRLSNN